ncbi:MAG: WecB/TagA/CpsF family glycosyltransferase [Thiohalomonadaceae bacterium]
MRRDISITQQRGVFSFLNPYSYLHLRKNAVAEELDGFYLDGVALVWLWNLFGRQQVRRISFDMTSLAPVLFNRACAEGATVYFVGSKQDVVDRAVATFQEQYPTLNVIGYRHGYFESESEWRDAAVGIATLNPDLIIVGMGAPLQEKFLIEVRQSGWHGLGFTCGGFLHQTASKGIRYYPRIVDKLNLRWAFRILDEPRLLWRYAIDYPRGLLVFLADTTKGKIAVRVDEAFPSPLLRINNGKR